jgi:hypothetical protein
MMAPMESISLRSRCIARVKFVALPLEPDFAPACGTAPEPDPSRPEPRFLRWLRRFGIRVINSPSAARP